MTTRCCSIREGMPLRAGEAQLVQLAHFAAQKTLAGSRPIQWDASFIFEPCGLLKVVQSQTGPRSKERNRGAG